MLDTLRKVLFSSFDPFVVQEQPRELAAEGLAHCLVLLDISLKSLPAIPLVGISRFGRVLGSLGPTKSALVIVGRDELMSVGQHVSVFWVELDASALST